MRKGEKSLTALAGAGVWSSEHFGGADLGDTRRANDWYGWPR